MPGPCDPGSPRELQDSTNTLGPVLQWPEEQAGRKGEEGKGHWAVLLSAALFSAYVLFVSAETRVAQSTASKPGFSRMLTPQTALWHLHPPRAQIPQRTKGLSRSGTQYISPQSP